MLELGRIGYSLFVGLGGVCCLLLGVWLSAC